MADFRPKLLLSELAMFAGAQALGLLAGFSMLAQGQAQFMETKPALLSFFIAFIIATTILIVALKFLKGPFSFKFFFGFLIFVGAQIIFSLFTPVLLSFALALAVVGVRFLWPNLITHNLAMFLAIAGVSSKLGTMLPVPAVLVILLALSIYDIIAVFKTKHMVTMFKDLLQRGAPMAMVIPENIGAFGTSMKQAVASKLKEGKRKFLMLGTGDMAFPIVFAVSALASYGLKSALFILAGSLVGIIMIHFLITQYKVQALPALPPIALFSTIGFLLSLV